MNNKIKNILFIFLCSLLTAASTTSAEIILDSQFGENGIVFMEFGRGIDEADAIAVQTDGRIVVAGTSDNGVDSDMAVIRYLPDGTVDADFLFSSALILGSGVGDDGFRALVINDDGTILLAGYITENDARSGAVVKLLADGRPDYGFGEQGVVIVTSGETDTELNDISVLSEGQIVVTGVAGDDDRTPLLARLLGEGLLDDRFGDQGLQIDSEVRGEAFGLAVQPDGKVLIAGYALDESGMAGLYLARYEAVGVLDPLFGTQGKVVEFSVDEEIIAHDIALQPDGHIVLAGQTITADGQSRIMLARYNVDGTPDQSVTDNGIIVHDSGTDSGAYSVSVIGNGVVLASGYSMVGDGRDMMILSYQADLQSLEEADPAVESDENTLSASEDEYGEIIKIASLQVEEGSFSAPSSQLMTAIPGAELTTTSLADSDDVSLAMTALPDGTVYTAGSSGTDEDTAFVVARYSENTIGVEALSQAGVVRTEFFLIETMPVTDVTRVGALTGGNIKTRGLSPETCIAGCEETCTEAADQATCEEQCSLGCDNPTVEKRGVVYSIIPLPEYDSDGDTETPDDGEDIVPAETIDPEAENETGDTTSANSGKLFDFDNYFVRSGQTDDGSGTGTYTSEIDGVNPQTIYYVRAYALLSDGSVIYGKVFQFKTKDACFIATAAFGSSHDYAVRILRNFRDHYLQPYILGQSFVSFYYRISPPLAELVERSLMLRVGVVLALQPLVIFAGFMLYTSLLIKYLLVASLLWFLYLRYHRQQGYESFYEKKHKRA
jgi:uncharacterized delta-60 repeat protein